MDKYKMIKEIMNSDLKEETKKELMEQPIIINYPIMQQSSQPWQITYTDRTNRTDGSCTIYSRG